MPSNELKTGQEADGSEDRGGCSHRGVVRAVGQRVERVSECAGKQDEPPAEAGAHRSTDRGRKQRTGRGVREDMTQVSVKR
jgi:hypothetical protein